MLAQVRPTHAHTPEMQPMKTSLTLAALLVLSVPALAADDWKSLFDGTTIDGWEVKGGKAIYKVEDGMIVGTTVEGSPNTFLCKGPFSDFELELDVLCDKSLNSGIQIRSHVYEKDTPQESNPKQVRKAGMVYGYQCEMAAAEAGVSGNFWDEAAPHEMVGRFFQQARGQQAFKNDAWNHYRIVAQGRPHSLLGQRRALRRLSRPNRRQRLHRPASPRDQKGTGPYSVRWKNVRIRELKAE